MPGAYARTATQALTNVTYRYIEMLADLGLADACQRQPALIGGINVTESARAAGDDYRTRDILLSDTVRVYRAMRAAGVDARLEVHEAMSHAEFNSAFASPESAVVFTEIAKFFDQHLAR